MNSPLHCREWNSHERGDAIEWHLVEKAQPQRHRVISWKTVEGLYRRFIAFFICDRPRQCFDLFEQRFIQGDTLSYVRRFALTEAQSSVACDGRQPCTKLARLFDPWQRLESEQ